jgi:site-specific recombinase XerD
MKLKLAVHNYIAYRKAMGEKFRTNETYLKAFCKYMESDIHIRDVLTEKVTEFLYGKGPITSSWFIKHTALVGFYQYAIGRHLVDFSPLPTMPPKRPPAFIPYIYTRDELRQLFKAAFTYQKNRSHVEPYMVNRILILLYGTGLRLSEALSLTMADVDFTQAFIIVKQTKFFKSRLVPFGNQMAGVLCEYIKWRKKQGYPQLEDSLFFYGRDDKPLNMNTMEQAFQRIRQKAGVQRADGARYQPRLHDLRHCFCVHRLTSWYQQNADVQQLLPVLSVYMGHTYLAATSAYLTMTNDLLQQAGGRFERYARGENNE